MLVLKKEVGHDQNFYRIKRDDELIGSVFSKTKIIFDRGTTLSTAELLELFYRINDTFYEDANYKPMSVG